MSKRTKKSGVPPGSIVFTGKRRVQATAIHYVEYNEKDFKAEKIVQTITSYHQPVEEFVQWYDMRGLHDTKVIEEIGKIFNVHDLALEDIANTKQRPKFDDYLSGNYISVVALSFDGDKLEINTEQISIYFGDGFLLSFQEKEEDLFLKIRERLENSKGRVRLKGADYLAYAVLDVVVDQYFVVLEEIEEWIENIEIEILKYAKEEHKSQIHHLRQEMLILRKAVAPLREAVGRFSRTDNTLVSKDTILYLRDLYDHCLRVMDTVDTARDNLVSLQDIYLSEISFRMNKVMQLFTVITTIFVPLSFLTGLYGMNFDNMPELHSQNGYFVLIAVMVFISVGLLYFFWKKRWL